jgi:hypothetical protein
MISLPAGVNIVKFYDSEMHKVGTGILYLLNNGIMFEKKGEGLKFECNFDYLASFEAVKKDKLLVVIRTAQGRKSVEFKANPASQVEYDISQVNQEYARNTSRSIPVDSTNIKNTGKQNSQFDHDLHSHSEARWFQENQKEIEKFLKPERMAYLNEFIKNAKIGCPDADPYLLVVDYENLTYRDFADLPGFLKYRYGTITDNEINMISSVFRDFDNFSVSMLEMDVQICKPREGSFRKNGYSLYQFVAIVAREKLESSRTRTQSYIQSD